MIQVMCWTNTGYRKQSRACFYAEAIIKETNKAVTFQLLDGEKIMVKRSNLISIETEEK